MSLSVSRSQDTAATELQRSVGVGRLSAGVLDGKTRVKRVYQEGAFKLRFPRRAFDADLDAVIINTAGGLTGGDRFEFHANIQSGADVTLTTQACERVYRSIGPNATYDIDLSVAADARLFWAPQETILFDRARFRRSLNVDLAPGA
ncbi:MAG: urease accessory protein UreD, partial [Pseudomonadota bacterium]